MFQIKFTCLADAEIGHFYFQWFIQIQEQRIEAYHYHFYFNIVLEIPTNAKC